MPEIGTYSITTKGINSSSKPYTYLVVSKPGFEIVANINNTFANEFYVNDRDVDEISVRIHDSDGLPFVNNMQISLLYSHIRVVLFLFFHHHQNG